MSCCLSSSSVIFLKEHNTHEFKFSGSLFEEFCLCRFHAGLLMSNFDCEHRVNIHFEHNSSLRRNHMLAVSERILWPRMFYNSGLQLQAIMWLLNNHWSLTVKNNQHCLNINRWTYMVRSAVVLAAIYNVLAMRQGHRPLGP